MAWSFLLALQATASAPPPQPPAVQPIDFDLARLRRLDLDAGAGPSRGCRTSGDGEIVVCGRRPSAGTYPIEEMARQFEIEPLVAETRLFGDVVGSAVVESVVFPRGEVSNRVMLRLRLPF